METMTANATGAYLAPVAQSPAPVDQAQALSTELATLPEIINLNEGLRNRALLSINTKLDEVKKLDLTTLDVSLINSLDAQLNELQGKGESAAKVNLERRSPFTRRFDAIKSIFTKAENDISAAVTEVKTCRAKFNQELNRRAQIQQQEQQRIIDKQNAAVDYEKHCADCINYNYMAVVSNTILKFNNAFNTKSAEDFIEYEKTLRDWIPVFSPYAYDPIPNPLLTPEESIKIRTKTEAEVFAVLANDFVQKLTEERDRLVLLIPSRIMELNRIAIDPAAAAETQKRLADEEFGRLEKLKQENADRSEAVAATAETNKLNGMLDAVAAVPVIELTKGTKKKLKYEATTPKAMAALLTFWVQNNMHLLSVEELNKKFSFVVTAANKALNDPKDPKTITAEGLFVVEDFNTRSTGTK